VELELQRAVIDIAIITVVLSIVFLIINRKLVKFDPLSEPKGIVLVILMAAETVEKMVREKTNEEVTKKLAPYIATIAIYIFISNIAGLFALECPTANYSVTLTLAAVTCFLIEKYSIKAKGTKGYVKSFFEPYWPFFIINIISKASTLLSLSLRLFGNILAGSVLMSVVYQLLGSISGLIPVIGEFNFVGVIVAPVLHFYFDLFSGAMQTFIFMTLTITFIGNELPNEN